MTARRLTVAAGRNSGDRNVLDAVRRDLLDENVVAAADDIDVDCLTEIVGQMNRDISRWLGTGAHFDLPRAPHAASASIDSETMRTRMLCLQYLFCWLEMLRRCKRCAWSYRSRYL